MIAGAGRIGTTFAGAAAARRSALITYAMGGDPDLAASEAVILACIRGGADIVEIGIPFSDPIADGPVIQRAGQRALRAGTRLTGVIALAGRVRLAAPGVPVVLMGYLNPLLAMGLERFYEAAASAGVDAVIIPDALPEMSAGLMACARDHGVGTVFMVATTSAPERITAASKAATAFLYLTAVAGVTGARDGVAPDLAARIGAVKESSRLPVAVGFGLSQPEHLRALNGTADGLVVGSAIVSAAEQGPGAVEEKVRSLREALER